MSIANVAIEILPKSMHELAEVAGWPAAFIIIEHRGGTRLCMPTSAKESHWLYPLIGKEALQKIAAYYSGEEIDIPRCAAALQALKMQVIASELDAGKSNAEVARKFGYTERGIRLIRRRLEAEAYYKKQQIGMFDECTKK